MLSARAERRGRVWPLFVHLRLHYQLLFLSPLFAWGFLLGGGRSSIRAWVGFVAFHCFLYSGITAYNSYYDRDEGPIGGLRAPPAVSEGLLGFSWLIQGLGLGLALWVSSWFAALYCFVMLLSVAYSHPALRWKARPILSLAVVAWGQGAVGYFGGWLCAQDTPPPLLGTEALLGLGVAMLSAVGLYPLTQVYQIDEDRSRGDVTFAVAFGHTACFQFALVCVALASACSVPLVWRVFGGWDAALLAVGFALLLVTIESWRRRFHATVAANFTALHRLQLALSLGTLGYVGARLVLA